MSKDTPFAHDALDHWRRHFARQLASGRYHDQADYEQDFALALLQALPQFCPERGEWAGFGYRVLARRKSRLRRQRATSLRIVEANLDHLSDPHSFDDVVRKLDVQAICEQLTPSEQLLVDDARQACTITEIAHRRNCHRSTGVSDCNAYAALFNLLATTLPKSDPILIRLTAYLLTQASRARSFLSP